MATWFLQFFLKLRLVVYNILVWIEQMSDLSEREDIIWLTPEEFDVQQLTYLFGGSSKRRKDQNSLFPHLKDRIYRCREYPNGIYINKFGELCPNDQRSGVYQEIEADMKPDSDCEEYSDDPDNDESKDSADEAWAKEEEKVKQKRLNKKRKRAESDDDEDYEKSEDDDEDDEDLSDAEEVLSDGDGIEEEEDEDWEPSKKRAKKQHTKMASDDDDGSEDDTRSVDTEVEESEESDEDKTETKTRVTPPPSTVVEDLKCSVEVVEHYTNIENRRKLERLRTDKLIHYLETLTEEWAAIAKQAGRKCQGISKKPIKMTYESELLSKEPSCEFTFRKAGSKIKGGVTATLDCEKMNLICMCGEHHFENTRALYEHMDTVHFSPSLN